MMWVRPLDSTSARLLSGTEGGEAPFWSANGRALGFFADNKLKIVDTSGGSAVVVAEAPNNRGGSWNRDGTILFVPNFKKGLYQAAAAGGTPVPVLELDASKYRIAHGRDSCRMESISSIGQQLLALHLLGPTLRPWTAQKTDSY